MRNLLAALKSAVLAEISLVREILKKPQTRRWDG